MATGFHDQALTSTVAANSTAVVDEFAEIEEAEVEEIEVKGSADLYGNEVLEAVATYTLDEGGSLYEVHSPQTELPRLGSPQG